MNPDGAESSHYPPRLNDEFTGFTIGGPMVKNKLFMFGGFDEEIFPRNMSPFHLAILLLRRQACQPWLDASREAQNLTSFSKFGPLVFAAEIPQPVTRAVNSRTSMWCPAAPAPGSFIWRRYPLLRGSGARFNFVNRVDYQLGSDTSSLATSSIAAISSTLTSVMRAAGYPVSVPALASHSWSAGHTISTREWSMNSRVGFDRLNVDFWRKHDRHGL